MLIVDEAHGAHFAFHENLPLAAAACGADIFIQSTHKTLGSLTQAAMMHVRAHGRVDKARVRASLQLVQSTSPSYLLLSSLDAARHNMSLFGKHMLLKAIQMAQEAKNRILKLPGLSVVEAKINDSSMFQTDLTRLTVLLPLGVSGYELDSYLIDNYGVYAELPALRHVTFIFTASNSISDVENLVSAVSTFVRIPRTRNKETFEIGARFPASKPFRMTPREAFFSESETVPTWTAIGRVSADVLCPYPPGIPVIIPGEVVTSDAVETFRDILRRVGCVTGAPDDTLGSLRVIKDRFG